MPAGPVIALIDGEHHPAAVREALDRLDRERRLAGVVFCGGEEKVTVGALEAPRAHYGRPVVTGETPEAGVRRLSADTDARAVVDLADEPVLPPAAKLRLAALALHLGLEYEGPGLRLTVPEYASIGFDGPKLAVIGTGKRTGKTAVAGHWASLLREGGAKVVIVAMGRGGPAEPERAPAGISLDQLAAVAADGRHAASDYLEDAALAGVETIGCRRVGGGLAGEPFESNVVEGAKLAASLAPDAIVFEGSGSCLPPVAVDRTVCLVGDRRDALSHLAPYRLMRADLALVMGPGAPGRRDGERVQLVAEHCPGRVLRCTLVAEPVEEVPPSARVALFTTRVGSGEDIEPILSSIDPVVSSRKLADRPALTADLQKAEAERCDVYLTELKAAAMDTVGPCARAAGARVIFLRNRPVGVNESLDEALVELHANAAAVHV